MTIHCTPVEESERSSCRLGTAIATIVMSMKVIETAKIIAARIRFLLAPPVVSMPLRFVAAAAESSPFDSLAALMPDVFWIGLVLAAAIFLIGVFAGMRSRTTSLATGAAIGAYLGVMLAFPLLAIGLATS